MRAGKTEDELVAILQQAVCLLQAHRISLSDRSISDIEQEGGEEIGEGAVVGEGRAKEGSEGRWSLRLVLWV
jgi:hypothetical protein